MFLLSWQALFRISDNGMNVLFLFIHTLITLLYSKLHVKQLENLVHLLLRNMYSAKKLLEMLVIASQST